MFLKEGILVLTGLAAGSMVAAGIFALIVSVGIFTRLAHRTRTSAYTNLYEDAIIVGGTLANIMFVYSIKLPLYYIGITLTGLFFGIFVGCLAMALAEVGWSPSAVRSWEGFLLRLAPTLRDMQRRGLTFSMKY